MSFYRNRLDLMIGYISAVINHASEETNSIEENNKWEGDQFFSVFVEYIFFFLHLTFRRIYPLMEEKERDILMTQIVDLAIRSAIDSKGFFLDEQNKQELYDEWVQDYMGTMAEYGKLREYAEDEPVQMPLYWHFQKKVATLSGQGSNPGAIVALGLTLVTRAKNLNIDSFVKQLVSDRFKGG